MDMNGRINEIVEQYSDILFRIAIQHVNNYADAEDILQEVFKRCLLSDAIKNDEIDCLQAWLIRMTINLCRDHKKSFWQRMRQDSYDDISPMLAAPERLTDECMDVFDGLKKLSSAERNILYLDYLGYTNREIAEILHINPNSVNTKLQSVKNKVRKYTR